MTEEKIIINAENSSMGRVAAYAAKKSLLGNNVIIVNVEKAVITGRKDTNLNDYITKRQRGGDIQSGPFYPSSPEKVMKRTIRGMLPYKQERGRTALKRIKCYEKIPEEIGKEKMDKLENKEGITVGQLCKLLKGKNK
jgi:large subunit ribosomal protein L13